MSGRPRIAITGAGIVSPFGAGLAALDAVWSGESRLRAIGGEELIRLQGFAAPVSPGMTYAGAPRPEVFVGGDEEPVVAIARGAAAEAISQAGAGWSDLPPERRGCVIGTSKGGLQTFGRIAGGDRDGLLWTEAPASNACRRIAEETDCRAAAVCPVAACATGLVALQRAAELVRQGVCDAALAGSADASLNVAMLACFDRLGVLAPARDQPERACRPFSAARCGFAIGEGGAVFVLQRWETVPAGQPILAEWLGGCELSDPTGLTLLDPQGDTLPRLITNLEMFTGVPTAEVDAISVHGTGTRINDELEAAGLRQVFGGEIPPCFALKGSLGHLLGAAGSVETAVVVEALRRQAVPPSPGGVPIDPDCAIPLSEKPQSRRLRTVLKLSLGFGGHFAAALLRRGEE